MLSDKDTRNCNKNELGVELVICGYPERDASSSIRSYEVMQEKSREQKSNMM